MTAPAVQVWKLRADYSEPNEADCRYIIIDVRGKDVLIECINSGMSIAPTEQVRRYQIEPA